MKAFAGFSLLQSEFSTYVDLDGMVDTDVLDMCGIRWRFSDGDDGPAFAGPGQTAVVGLSAAEEDFLCRWRLDRDAPITV